MAIKQQSGKKANEKAIEIVISMDTGVVTAEASGYEGQACSLDLNAVMTAAGQKTKHTPKTPEKDQVVHRIQRT